MKHIFLTSDIGAYKKIDGRKVACAFGNGNGLVDQIKKCVDKRDVFVFVASNPNGFEKTDAYATIIMESFRLAGFDFNECVVVDNRNKDSLQDLIQRAGIVYLAGGHVPTQNDFIQSIGLKELLLNYNGVIIGQSAGSMNLAEVVYNYPEDISEINDPKFLKGLGITNLTIVPHFNLETGNEQVEDGIDLMGDYLLKDSYKAPLYCLTNGAHVYLDGTQTKFCGDAYLIKDGKISNLSQTVLLNKDMKDIIVRPARVEDAEQYVKLHNFVWRCAYKDVFPEEVFVSREEKATSKIAKFKDNMINRDDNIVYVAECDGKIVGLMSGLLRCDEEYFKGKGYAELGAMYIHPDFQKLGIGKSFKEIFINWAIKHGVDKFVICALKDNIKARKIYEKWGGQISLERPFRLLDKEYDDVFYTYDINEIK